MSDLGKGLAAADWGLILNAAQLGALVLLLVFAVIVLRQALRAGRAANRAAVAARRSARASERRARAAEDALREGQRPWVVAEGLTLMRPDVWVQGRFDARVELIARNTEVAPARNLKVMITAAPSPQAPVTDAFVRGGASFFDARPRGEMMTPPPALSDDTLSATAEGADTVAPGQEVAQAVRLASTEVGLRDIIPGGLFVFGRLEYQDAQGGAHSTRFAFQLANRDGAWRFDARPALGAAD
jgi:hypothetical protein